MAALKTGVHGTPYVYYLRVVFPGPPAWRNRRVMVRLRARDGESLTGEAVDR